MVSRNLASRVGGTEESPSPAVTLEPTWEEEWESPWLFWIAQLGSGKWS